ncbi:MAG: hypothetical protein ACREPQ_14510 [Rhodanobacter sp.]
MSDILNDLAQAVREGDKIILTLSRNASGTIRCVVTPSIQNADENDVDACRRELVASLGRPFLLDVAPGANVTNALAGALLQVGQSRAQAMSALETYTTLLDDASARARSATAAKVKGAAKASPTQPPVADLIAEPGTEDKPVVGAAPEAAAAPAGGLFEGIQQ